MPTIKIKEPGKPDKWVEKLDKLTGEITFTTNKSRAYHRDGSFYCNSEIKTLKCTNPPQYDHEKYPELQYAVIDSD